MDLKPADPGGRIGAGAVPLTGEPALTRLQTEGLYASLAAAYENARYAAKVGDDVPVLSEFGFRFPSSPAAQAHNPAQRIRSTFTPEGLNLEVRTGESTHQVGWRLDSLGYGTLQRSVPPGELSVHGQRVEILRDGQIPLGNHRLIEWFHNTPGGLEHGFTLEDRPAANPSGAPLCLVLAVTGDLRPEAMAGGQRLQLRNPAGQTVLSYDKLKVWDADGVDVPATLEVVADTVRLSVDERQARYPLTIDPTFTQQTYLKASNPGGADPSLDFVNGDTFGRSVAVSGDTVVIGAPGEDSNANTINGDGSNNEIFDSGAAYVFVRSGSTWIQQAYLKAGNNDSQGNGTDSFGSRVAISGDTVVVGAPGEDSAAAGVNGDGSDNSLRSSGAAYVFVRSGSTWTQQAYLKASNPGELDTFGIAVAISGETIVVGASREDSDATGINGSGGNNDASDSGAAYVFVRNGSTWTQQAYLKAGNTGSGDLFGLSVSVSGNTVVVGARREDSSATGVNGVGRDFDGDGSEDEVTNSGAAYVFVRNGTTWTQQAFLKPGSPDLDTAEDTLFGTVVTVTGDTLIVGAPGEPTRADGEAYVFVRQGTKWSEQVRLSTLAKDFLDSVGTAVGDGDTLAYRVDSGLNRAVRIFRRTGQKWAELATLAPGNAGDSDEFGNAIALSGDLVVVGAPFEQSAAPGINGNGNDNSLNEAGAAYLFDLPPSSSSAPEIGVEQPSGTSLADGAVQAFGKVSVGTNTSLTFLVRNTGAADLTGLQLSIEGPDAGQFTVTTSPVAPVTGPGGSTSFVVRFAPTTGGVKTATLHLANNDADEGPFDLTLQGEGVLVVDLPPTLTLPVSPMVTEATSADGATVVFKVSALDPEDGPLTPVSVPASGSVFPVGETTVQVSVKDAAGHQVQGSFVVRVTAANRPPSFSGLNLRVRQNQGATIPRSELLAAASDPDADPILLTGVSAASLAGGTVTLGDDGVSYTPPQNGVGADAFTLTLSDGRGGITTGTIQVSIRVDHFQFLPSGAIQSCFAGDPGTRYAVERSANLAQWETLVVIPAAADGAVCFTDSTPPSGKAFYRTRRVP